jgi:DNA-binding response OmpR family regulator
MRAERSDVVVTDWEMVPMDGYDLVVEMSRDPALWGIPVIVHSALPRPRPDEATNLAVYANSIKSFSSRELLASVGAILRR